MTCRNTRETRETLTGEIQNASIEVVFAVNSLYTFFLLLLIALNQIGPNHSWVLIKNRIPTALAVIAYDQQCCDNKRKKRMQKRILNGVDIVLMTVENKRIEIKYAIWLQCKFITTNAPAHIQPVFFRLFYSILMLKNESNLLKNLVVCCSRFTLTLFYLCSTWSHQSALISRDEMLYDDDGMAI